MSKSLLHKKSIRHILLIENHPVVQTGIRCMLENSCISHTFHLASTIQEGLTRVKSQKFQLVILDVDYAGMSYSSILAELKSLDPDVNILVFSMYDEHIFALPFIQMGANGYINKSAQESEILEAIETVMNCETYVSKEINQTILSGWTGQSRSTNPLQQLSTRETDVLMLLVRGDTTSDISHTLNLQPSTISTYKRRIFKKMNVSNDLELVEKFKILAQMI